MASAVDSRLAYARLSAVATASRLPTANRGSNNSYTTSWDTTLCRCVNAEAMSYAATKRSTNLYLVGTLPGNRNQPRRNRTDRVCRAVVA